MEERADRRGSDPGRNPHPLAGLDAGPGAARPGRGSACVLRPGSLGPGRFGSHQGRDHCTLDRCALHLLRRTHGTRTPRSPSAATSPCRTSARTRRSRTPYSTPATSAAAVSARLRWSCSRPAAASSAYLADAQSSPALGDAFLDAGAGMVVHTYREVRDDEAHDFMAAVIDRWMGQGMSVPEAVHGAGDADRLDDRTSLLLGELLVQGVGSVRNRRNSAGREEGGATGNSRNATRLDFDSVDAAISVRYRRNCYFQPPSATLATKPRLQIPTRQSPDRAGNPIRRNWRKYLRTFLRRPGKSIFGIRIRSSYPHGWARRPLRPPHMKLHPGCATGSPNMGTPNRRHPDWKLADSVLAGSLRAWHEFVTRYFGADLLGPAPAPVGRGRRPHRVRRSPGDPPRIQAESIPGRIGALDLAGGRGPAPCDRCGPQELRPLGPAPGDPESARGPGN